MGYCTPSQVGALDQGRMPFTASSRPALTEVQQFIDQTAAEIDSILGGAGWDMPVPTTASSAYTLVSYFNALGADALVQRAAQSSDRVDTAAAAWESARQTLKTVNLIGVAMTGAEGPPTNTRYPQPVASAMFTLDEDD